MNCYEYYRKEYIESIRTSGIVASTHKVLATKTPHSNSFDNTVLMSALLKYQLIQPLNINVFSKLVFVVYQALF